MAELFVNGVLELDLETQPFALQFGDGSQVFVVLALAVRPFPQSFATAVKLLILLGLKFLKVKQVLVEKVVDGRSGLMDVGPQLDVVDTARPHLGIDTFGLTRGAAL